jgi:hypothetical protein
MNCGAYKDRKAFEIKVAEKNADKAKAAAK